jgi:hypothetical protein
LGQGETRGLLVACPGNAPPTEGPFVCVVPVKDYWRMIAALARRNGVSHYAEVIDREVLEAVKARRCALIFDLCNEGPAYSADIFDELFRWIETNQLPPGQIVWLAQNRAMEAQCRAAAGLRAEFVTFEYYDFFVKMIALLFAPGPGQPVVGGDPVIFIDRMFDPSGKDRLLLCLNATPRVPRVLTVAALIHHGLLNGSLVSFPGLNYVKGPGSTAEVRAYVEVNPSLAYLTPSLATTFELRDLSVDAFTEKGNALFAKVDVRPYERTFFSLVTETEFTDGSVARVTEKIVKPFCLGHPSFVIGNPHSVRFMTELGFQDWEDVIDRSYEAQADPPTRFGMVFDEVLRQVRSIRSDPAAWLGRVQDVGAANIRHASSGQFLARYCAIYDRPVVARLASLVGTQVAV